MTLDELLEHHKTKRAIAFAYNITPQAISHWFKLGYVPFYTQIKIEHLSKGQFKADEYDKNSKRNCHHNYRHKDSIK